MVSYLTIACARQLTALQVEYRRELAEFTKEDVTGSLYCVHCYVVDEHLGEPKGLALARKILAAHGMGSLRGFLKSSFFPC